MAKHSNELPKDVVDRLRRIVAFTGNEKAVDEDPLKVMLMFLHGIETHSAFLSGGSLRFVIRKYCSADGMSTYADALQKKKEVA